MNNNTTVCTEGWGRSEPRRMELKVWVEGIQRIVCGVTEKTTCQDVVYALAHATGKTGRFTLIERWRNNERLLAPQEHPLKVLAKWGEYSNDVQFILQRSPLDSSKTTSPAPGKGDGVKKSNTYSGNLSNQGLTQPAIWKTPPVSGKPIIPGGRLGPESRPGAQDSAARLSPDSGQGSDPTGSDTSNFSDQEKALRGGAGGAIPRPPNTGLPPSGYTPPGWGRGPTAHRITSPSPDRSGEYGYGRGGGPGLPPAYRAPPQPRDPRQPSPADPPPYREPPPPPPGLKSPPTTRQGLHPANTQSTTPPRTSGPPIPRLTPHYSPPPHHREVRPGSHSRSTNSPGRSIRTQASPARGQNSPTRSSWARFSQSGTQSGPTNPKSDYTDLINLVSAQQNRLQSQHTEIKHCDNELKYWVDAPNGPGRPGDMPEYLGPGQMEGLIQEVRRLEEAALHNEEEMQIFQERSHSPTLRNELEQLRIRLEKTDLELQKTNQTLRRLSDEMRTYSQEKSRQREEELRAEVERIQAEIKLLQRTSEDSATVSDKLNREVLDVENQIAQRKAEVEKLIQDMKTANLESLTISPPEESKALLDGPAKPGSSRKMLGSPRQLENAVPTSKNPHGVWV